MSWHPESVADRITHRGSPMVRHLVPALERMVGEIVAKDFWANHLINQNELDRQNEPDMGVIRHLVESFLGKRYHRVLGHNLEAK